jgi:hypothetical protein
MPSGVAGADAVASTSANSIMRRMSIWKKYGFAWVTVGLFLFSLLGHAILGWFAFVQEQQAHGEPIEVSQYLVVMGATSSRTGSRNSYSWSGRSWD